MLFYQRTFCGFHSNQLQIHQCEAPTVVKKSENQPGCELFLCYIKYGKSFWKILRIKMTELVVVAILQNQKGSNNEKHLY